MMHKSIETTLERQAQLYGHMLDRGWELILLAPRKTIMRKTLSSGSSIVAWWGSGSTDVEIGYVPGRDLDGDYGPVSGHVGTDFNRDRWYPSLVVEEIAEAKTDLYDCDWCPQHGRCEVCENEKAEIKGEE